MTVEDMRLPISRSQWKQCARCGRVGALVFACVLFILPLRNALLSHFMPGAWLEHNSLRIARVLLDNQHFPIDDPFVHHAMDLALRPVNLSGMAKVADFMSKEDPYAKYHKLVDRLTREDERLSKDRSPASHEQSWAARDLSLLKQFKPSMTRQDRAQLLFTMDVFARVCRQYDLFYFIIEGSLLGAYRHHGMVPWDDDIDIAMNASDWRRARAVLGNIPGMTLYARGDVQWKLYISDLPPFRDKPFRYPHLDIFFFHEDDTHMWAVTWGTKDHLLVRKEYVLPLSSVYYENFWLPAPRCVERMVISNYGGSGCILPSYVHKTNEEHYGFQSERTACSNLHDVFPFVFRSPDPNTGAIVESRKVGSRVIENITVPAPDAVCFT